MYFIIKPCLKHLFAYSIINAYECLYLLVEDIVLVAIAALIGSFYKIVQLYFISEIYAHSVNISDLPSQG